MKKNIALFTLLALISCGLGARFQGAEISGTTSVIRADASIGTVIGNVSVSNSKCSDIDYALENDYNGYFKVNDSGQITLGKENPLEGTYPIVIIGTCDDQRKSISLNIIITPVVTTSISTTPFLTQLGAVTPVPGGSTTGDEACGAIPLFGAFVSGKTVVDNTGNTYCAGQTTGSLGEGFGGGSSDAFIAKFNADGNLAWIKQFGNTTVVPGGSTAGDDACNTVAVDSLGNVYCAGYTSGSLGEAVSGPYDAFVVKLDSSGNLVWLKQLGAVTVVPGGSTAGADFCFGVDVDSLGNVYCSGSTSGALGEGFGGGFSYGDAFIMKLDTSGNLVWIRQLGNTTIVPGGSSVLDEMCLSVKVDDLGNVYCGGTTNSDLGEGNGGGGVGFFYGDAFVMKLDSLGNLTWLRQLGDTTVVPGNTLGSEYCSSVNVDFAGNVYCAGSTTGGLGEGNGGVGPFPLDAFVMKLDSAGSIIWLRQLGDTTIVSGDTSGNEICTGIDIDAVGNVYCGGASDGSLGEAASVASFPDALIIKFNPSGEIVWMKKLGAVTAVPSGSNAASSVCFGVAVDTVGNVYCTGTTNGDLGEGYGGGATLYGDIFVLKLNSAGELL